MSEPVNRSAQLADVIDALLPQTQCTQCGFPGCRPYADAVAQGRADINRCPPGGDEGIREIAALLGVAVKPLDPSSGPQHPPAVAQIREEDCIGCTLCMEACPVDAIVGAAKHLHTVIAAECTGCRLCIPPCPVNCIDMMPTHEAPRRAALLQTASRAKTRYEQRNARLARQRKRSPASGGTTTQPDSKKQAVISRVLARARQRLGKST